MRRSGLTSGAMRKQRPTIKNTLLEPAVWREPAQQHLRSRYASSETLWFWHSLLSVWTLLIRPSYYTFASIDCLLKLQSRYMRSWCLTYSYEIVQAWSQSVVWSFFIRLKLRNEQSSWFHVRSHLRTKYDLLFIYDNPRWDDEQIGNDQVTKLVSLLSMSSLAWCTWLIPLTLVSMGIMLGGYGQVVGTVKHMSI